MLIGANVKATRDLVSALGRGSEIGADVIQIFTGSPRIWESPHYRDDVLATYRETQSAHPHILFTYCHASYLINIASPDPEIFDRSRASLMENLRIASLLGSAGLVLHLGSHRGAGFASCVQHVADELRRALDAVGASTSAPPAPILMENAAGAGGTIGSTFEELAGVLEAAHGDERLLICVDTQHLFASGHSYASLAEADALVGDIAATVGLDRVTCLHLNDSASERGSRRDRHANIGEGLIGATALGSLLGHPALRNLPAILEVPGTNRRGPAAGDVAAARRAAANGIRRWDKALRSGVYSAASASASARAG